MGHISDHALNTVVNYFANTSIFGRTQQQWTNHPCSTKVPSHNIELHTWTAVTGVNGRDFGVRCRHGWDCILPSWCLLPSWRVLPSQLKVYNSNNFYAIDSKMNIFLPLPSPWHLWFVCLFSLKIYIKG